MVRNCGETCPECKEDLLAISVPGLGCVVRPRRMSHCPNYRRRRKSREVCRSLGMEEAEAIERFLRREHV